MTNKILDDKNLENVTGGTDFTIYDYTFTENTKLKDILKKFPWLGDLYPQLKQAASFGLTVGQAMGMGQMDAAELQRLLDEGVSKYNPDGTLK